MLHSHRDHSKSTTNSTLRAETHIRQQLWRSRPREYTSDNRYEVESKSSKRWQSCTSQRECVQTVVYAAAALETLRPSSDCAGRAIPPGLLGRYMTEPRTATHSDRKHHTRTAIALALITESHSIDTLGAES